MANFYFKAFCFASFLALQVISGTNSYAQKQVAKKTNKNVGYLEYLPAGYNKKSEHPVIIFLHGTGEKGNGKSDIHKVKYHGPPKLIDKGKWPSDYPFIVISPQLFSNYDHWPASFVDDIVEYVISKYKVDEDRIYLTGLSLGGGGTWSYAADFPGKVAAIAPIAGWGPNNKASKMKDVPVWAFHGNADGIVDISGSRDMINALNGCKPKPAVKPKFTVYSRVGHDSWTRTYDRSAGHNIYAWFLSHSKEGGATNKKPTAHAGPDKELTLPANSIKIKGSGSDADGNIKSYSWSKRSGSSVKMEGTNKKGLSLSQMKAGHYEFRLTVKDNDNATSYDDVKVRVHASSGHTGNNGLTYKYYEGNWNKLPDFKGITPKRSGKVSHVTLQPREKDDYFAFKFDGYIKIAKAGDYTFYTSSDDGSKLYINGRSIVNNDGQHGKMERSGKVKLSAGLHAISVTYFEKKGGENLQIKYAGPGLSKRAIPSSALFSHNNNNNNKMAKTGPEKDETEAGLIYAYFEGNWSKLPTFSNLNAVKTGKALNFDLGPRRRNDRFAFMYQGNISIDTDGHYTFYTTSDDGSKLYINGKPVVNNDGLHGKRESSGKVYLTQGEHQIKVAYFKDSGNEILEVKYEGPGITKRNIPNSKLTIGNETGHALLASALEFENNISDPSMTFNIYPNPFVDRLKLDVQLEEASILEITLSDLQGRTVYSRSETPEKGLSTLQIDLSNIRLESGIYLMNVNGPTLNFSRKIIKK